MNEFEATPRQTTESSLTRDADAQRVRRALHRSKPDRAHREHHFLLLVDQIQHSPPRVQHRDDLIQDSADSLHSSLALGPRSPRAAVGGTRGPVAQAREHEHGGCSARTRSGGLISIGLARNLDLQPSGAGRWARGLCGATQRDSLAGRRLGAAIYEYIDYSSFVRRPVQVVEGLYRRHFNRAVPPEVRQYIAKHLPNRTARGGKSPSALPLSWQFQFGTDARDVEAVDQRWQLELKSWERQAIEVGCPRLRPTPTLLDRVALKIPNM